MSVGCDARVAEDVDEKLKATDQHGNLLNFLWPGQRMLSLDDVKITPFQAADGMPHHPLLPNVSVFLQPDVMRSYNTLAASTDNWGELSDEERSELVKEINNIMQKAQYGFWAVASDAQIKNADGLTLEDLNYGKDGSIKLSAFIFSDDEVLKVLGNNVKNVAAVEKKRDSVIAKWSSDKNSNYIEKSFSEVMAKYPTLISRHFVVTRGDETWSGTYYNICSPASHTGVETIFMPVRVAESKKQQATPAQLAVDNHVDVFLMDKNRASRKQAAPTRNKRTTAPSNLGRKRTVAETSEEPAVTLVSNPPVKKSKSNLYPGLQTVSQCVSAVLEVIEQPSLDASLCPLPDSIISKPITKATLESAAPECAEGIISGINLLVANNAYQELPKALEEIEAQRKAVQDLLQAQAEQQSQIKQLEEKLAASSQHVKLLEQQAEEQKAVIQDQTAKIEELSKKPLSLTDRLKAGLTKKSQ